MASGHRLLDVGGGARLERFATRLIDRPLPTALGARRDPGAWRAADLRFERDRGWSGDEEARRPWLIEIDGVTLELRPTEAGQVGLFPEHAAMLPWLRDQVAARNEVGDATAVLHLFAYTGLVTLALAVADARVTHVDAARPAVAWARHNATLSGLGDRPIRWIVDDATAFTAREVRRGRRYAGVVLDPPSYGHGPGAGAWRIGDDLAPLLEAIARLLVPDGFLLLTAHTPELGSQRLAGAVARALDRSVASIDAGDLGLETPDGRRAELGAFARWSGGA